MAEYTSSREGFQRAMKWSLTGTAETAREYCDAVSTPGFYQVMNDNHLAYEAYVQGVAEWRGKISDYEPEVKEFLRDGDQLAARMIGTIKVDGAPMKFESFMFAKVEKATGKMEHLIERSVWGPVDGENVHGLT